MSPSTTSGHLARLVDGGILTVQASGRHRYYQLAGPDVSAAVEALAVIAPQPPVTSLRESTRAAALRRARTCYDHLAGQFGVALLESLVERSALTRADGLAGIDRAPTERLAAPVASCPYTVGPDAEPVFARIGVRLAPLLDRAPSARPLLRCCVDWSEQRHHLAGALGAAVLERAGDAGWVRRRPGGRAVEITTAGRTAFGDALGIQLVA